MFDEVVAKLLYDYLGYNFKKNLHFLKTRRPQISLVKGIRNELFYYIIAIY